MSETLTLTDFLLARIAEDEATARYATTRDSVGQADWGGWWFGHQQHYSRHNPARVLAECEAKRGAIDAAWTDHVQIEGEWGMSQSREQMSAEGDSPEAVAWLALPYADHPDYREEWRA